MNDEELLQGLKAAARRRHEAEPAVPPELAAPLGPAFESQMVAKIARAPAKPAKARRGKVFLFAAPLAAAAAVALWLAWPGSRSPMAPLPSYAMEVSGGVDTVRGAPEARTDISARPGDTITIVLRPANDVSQPIQARVFAKASDDWTAPNAAGPPREIPVTTRVSTTGSVELRANVSDVAPGPEADVSATIVLSRPGLDAAALAAPGATVPADARVFPLHVHVAR